MDTKEDRNPETGILYIWYREDRVKHILAAKLEELIKRMEGEKNPYNQSSELKEHQGFEDGLYTSILIARDVMKEGEET